MYVFKAIWVIIESLFFAKINLAENHAAKISPDNNLIAVNNAGQKGNVDQAFFRFLLLQMNGSLSMSTFASLPASLANAYQKQGNAAVINPLAWQKSLNQSDFMCSKLPMAKLTGCGLVVE